MFNENNFETEQEKDSVKNLENNPASSQEEISNEAQNVPQNESLNPLPAEGTAESPAEVQIPSYTANPYNMNNQQSGTFRSPSGSYGYSYDYSSQPQQKQKSNHGILVFLAIVASFCALACVIVAILSFSGSMIAPDTPVGTLTPSETVTTVPETTITQIPDTGSTEAPVTENIPVYGENDGWINDGTITTDDAYINATYQTIDTVVAITTETASYNSAYGNYVSKGAGSGVVFAEETNENGTKIATYIITNNHVVSGATKIKVTLTNGDTHQATLVGTDAQTDIAVIKVSVVGLRIASLGDSSKILLSEPVIAIGNPLGELANTVTDGRISGLERNVTIDGITMSLIQTNAAVNPGNSGGGLFDLKGKLIGIVNAKSSGSSIEGIGFAIPINTAKAVAEDIIKYGYVSGRPSIGIYGSLVSKDNYSYYKESDVYSFIYDYYYANNNAILEGFYIENDDYVKYSSENGEKFQKGDVVAEINGTKVQTSADISNALSSYEIGETITISVYRLVKTTGTFGREKTEIRSFDVSVVLVEKTS